MMATGNSGQGTPSSQPPISNITFPGNDAYVAWALGAGRADFFPRHDQRDWISVLLELKGISALAFARGEDEAGNPLLDVDEPIKVWRRSVVVPPLYLREGDGVKDVLHLTAFVRETFLSSFLEEDFGAGLQNVVSAVRIGTLPPASALDGRLMQEDVQIEPEPIHWPDLSGNPPSDGVVIMGIIDDGIPFGHERFWQDHAKTRVCSVWLQDRAFRAGPELQGRVLTRSEIDEALADATHGGLIDEDLFYKKTGAVDFTRDRPKSVAKHVSHGGHVMDIACGYGVFGEKASISPKDRLIVAVQLPTESTADTSGQGLEPYLDAAIVSILHRAHLIAAERGTGPIPVVINCSYGHHLGAHDGSSLLERAIEQRIVDRQARDEVPLRVVLPSGNSHLTRTHAELSFDNGLEAKTLRWRVQPDDKTWSFMEIWLPKGAPTDRIEISITPSGGAGMTSPLGETVNGFQQWPPGETDAYACRITYKHDGHNDRGFFLLELAPTERLGPSHGPAALPGVWEIRLKQNSPIEGAVEAWIWRDDPPLGFPRRGRQSYFDHKDYRRYNDAGRLIEVDDPASLIRREGAINGLATSDGEVIVAGGYLRKEQRSSPYSAGGLTNGSRLGPDISAVSDDSAVHGGVLAAGTRSGSVAALTGTSVAAPAIARWIANNVDGNRLPGRFELAAAALIELGSQRRSGHGGIDQTKIDGLPIVVFPRIEGP